MPIDKDRADIDKGDKVIGDEATPSTEVWGWCPRRIYIWENKKKTWEIFQT